MDLIKPYKTVMISDTNKALIEIGKTKGKNTSNLYYKDQTKPWFHNKNLPREHVVTINRYRSDHYNLAASLTRVYCQGFNMSMFTTRSMS